MIPDRKSIIHRSVGCIVTNEVPTIKRMTKDSPDLVSTDYFIHHFCRLGCLEFLGETMLLLKQHTHPLTIKIVLLQNKITLYNSVKYVLQFKNKGFNTPSNLPYVPIGKMTDMKVIYDEVKKRFHLPIKDPNQKLD